MMDNRCYQFLSISTGLNSNRPCPQISIITKKDADSYKLTFIKKGPHKSRDACYIPSYTHKEISKIGWENINDNKFIILTQHNKAWNKIVNEFDELKKKISMLFVVYIFKCV